MVSDLICLTLGICGNIIVDQCSDFLLVNMRIEHSGLTRVVACAPAFFELPEDQKLSARIGGNDTLPAKISDDQCSTSSSSTSSIGRNSDLSSDRSTEDEDCGENEAQSAYNGPLDMMESLEEVLPIRYHAFPTHPSQIPTDKLICFFFHKKK